MPVYNAENTISDTLRSIVSQNYQNFELIVVNDGSTDNSLSIIEKFATKFKNFQLISTKNVGVTHARNVALRACSGEFVAFIDADDLWHPQKLAQQHKHLVENPSCSLTYTDTNIIDDTGDLLSVRISPPEVTYKSLKLYNPIVLSSAVISARLAKSIEFQSIGHEDYLFWLRAIKATQSLSVCLKTNYDISLTSYRKHSGSLSSSKLKSACWHYSVLSELDIPILLRIYLLTRYALNGIKLHIKEIKINKRRI